ncbi:MAG: hypothetical protein C5B55_03715 [Blastocatellia bacterium]|nr:MAG: hypothetical protein C5B55_03715 [Blastocatellia bacterium]
MKDQHKLGIPSKPRGQQTGFKGHQDHSRESMAETPALRGRRKEANKMFADASEQHIGGDATKPSTNSPSIPAMNVKAKTNAGGEKVFKKRLAKNRRDR